MKQKKRKTFQIGKKEIHDHLVELVNTLNKKETYQYHDRDDLDYYGIRDIENLFDDDDDNDYYKPILVESSFKNNYKYYENRGDQDKKQQCQKTVKSVKQYLYKIMSYLRDKINDHKAIRNESDEWKIQINMCKFYFLQRYRRNSYYLCVE